MGKTKERKPKELTEEQKEHDYVASGLWAVDQWWKNYGPKDRGGNYTRVNGLHHRTPEVDLRLDGAPESVSRSSGYYTDVRDVRNGNKQGYLRPGQAYGRKFFTLDKHHTWKQWEADFKEKWGKKVTRGTTDYRVRVSAQAWTTVDVYVVARNKEEAAKLGMEKAKKEFSGMKAQWSFEAEEHNAKQKVKLMMDSME